MTSSLLSLSSLRSSFRRRRLLSTARSFKGIKRFYDTVDVVAAESDGGKHVSKLRSASQGCFVQLPRESVAMTALTCWPSKCMQTPAPVRLTNSFAGSVARLANVSVIV